MRFRAILLTAAILGTTILLAIVWIITSIWNNPTPAAAQVELLKFLLQILSVVILGSAASALVAEYNRRRQEAEARKELNIATVTQFQQLYGEYKSLWKLWGVYLHKDRYTFELPEHTHWELLNRAIAAEGKVEAIIIKLAMERRLDTDDIQTLGMFRESFQIVRRAIREHKPLIENKAQQEIANQVFHELTVKVAHIISSRKRVTDITPERSQNVLMSIMAVPQTDLAKAARSTKKEQSL